MSQPIPEADDPPARSSDAWWRDRSVKTRSSARLGHRRRRHGIGVLGI
jgi:hypothetical protein